MATTYERDRGFTIKRVFNAPAEMVFQAWTDPQYLDWFFNDTMPHDNPISVDLRAGGEWRQQMVINDETQYMTGGVYREIVPNTRLVFAWGAAGGWPAVDLKDLDKGPQVTIAFNALGERTEMVFRLQLPDHFSEEEAHEWTATGMLDGWGMTIDRLVARYEPRGERARA
jgi:uncharacterized protein YndB with AHSA1/START domain